MSADVEAVIDLLAKGFWRAPREHFVMVMQTLAHHRAPAGYPQYGYLLEHNGRPVGVLLTIFTERIINGTRRIWCSQSSYCAEPPFQALAGLMILRAERFKGVTFLDLTASPARFGIIIKHGYRRLAQGIYLAVPMFCKPVSDAQVRHVGPTYVDGRLTAHELELLADHARFNKCLVLICEHENVVHPFVFGLRRKFGIPFAFLLYSRSPSEFIRFAGTLGRFLARRGILLALLDSDGPIAGMPGKFMEWRPKFWKGEEAPPLGDLSYTEVAMFGVF